MSDPRTIFTSVTPEARSKISPENFTLTMNYGKQAISREFVRSDLLRGWTGRMPRVGRSGSHKKCSQWDDKSNFRSGCTEPWPIVAFYMQSRVKLWRGKRRRRWQRILWPGSDHCATCWPEASLCYYRESGSHYLNAFRPLFQLANTRGAL